MRVLHAELEKAGIRILESVYGNTLWLNRTLPVYDPANLEAADVIVVNGEGTMHDDSKMSVFLLERILADRGRRKAALVNSLWQNMSPEYTELVSTLDVVVMRDPLSLAACGAPAAQLMPDLSFYEIPAWSRLEDQGFVKGTFYSRAFWDLSLDSALDVRHEDWGFLVNKLRHARALLTGKHHEVYAACLARCPFITTRLQTHKIAALGAFIGAELPTLDPDADPATVQLALEVAADDQQGVFARLFDTLERLRSDRQLAQILKALI